MNYRQQFATPHASIHSVSTPRFPLPPGHTLITQEIKALHDSYQLVNKGINSSAAAEPAK